MSLVDIGLFASYVLIGLCALAAILLPLIQSFGDPKSLIKSGIGVGALVVVFFIAYAMADGSSMGTTTGTSKMVGAGLITMYLATAGAIIGIVYTEVSKLFK